MVKVYSGMIVDDCILSNQDDIEWKSFAEALDGENSKQYENNSMLRGKIVRISDKVAVWIDGHKSEKYMDLDEIKDKNGNLNFREGDEIDLLLVNRGISHKQAIKKSNQIKAIEKLDRNKFLNTIIDVKIVGKNRGGYIANWNINEDSIDCFMPYNVSAIKRELPFPNKLIKVCITNINNDSVTISRKKYFDVNNKQKDEELKKILSNSGAIKGEVVSVTHFGIFVSINGIEGLVHASEISHKNFTDPTKLYKIGDSVLVKVLSYDEEKSKLSLSIKALSNNPWQDIENGLKVGYTVKAVVSSIQPYGAFIDIGNDIEGLLHITEMTWDKNIKHPQDIIEIGQEMDVEIIELDASKKKLRVSLKKLIDKPFKTFINKYNEGDVLKGKVATITDFGAFIRFCNVDGLLHNEDYSWEKDSKCRDKINVGDDIEVKILKINHNEEKKSD